MSTLDNFARSLLLTASNRARQKLGLSQVPSEAEQAQMQSQMQEQQFARRIQLAKIINDIGLSNREADAQDELRRAQADYYRSGAGLKDRTVPSADKPVIHFDTDEAGHVTATVVRKSADGAYTTEKIDVGDVGKPQQQHNTKPPTPYYTPMVDNTGNVVGTFNNRDGSITRIDAKGARKTALPPAEMEKRGLLTSMLSDVDELERLAKASGNIGPVAGRVTAAKRQTIGVDQDTEDLFHISENLADQLLRARSGAQINESEYRRLRRLVPDSRSPRPTFFADLRRFKIELQNTLNARQGNPVDQNPDTGATSTAATHDTSALPTPPNTKPIVQRNRSTGQTRYSLDGGATWQPGLPPR